MKILSKLQDLNNMGEQSIYTLLERWSNSPSKLGLTAFL